MKRIYESWFHNSPLKIKFLPTQITILILMVIMGILAVASVLTINRMTQEVFSKNVRKTEELNDIIRTMYVCRVLGRDILLSDNQESQFLLYSQYIAAFELLDRQMDDFVDNISTEDKRIIFNEIIEQKNIYRDSMILSADIDMQGGAFEDALRALTDVTPIANEFFGSIDEFLAEEKIAMESAIEQSNNTALAVFVIIIAVNIIGIILVYALGRALTNMISTRMILLETSVSKITHTNNMKTPIPGMLFTADEMGHIAIAVDHLREMILAFSFSDPLTQGYNAVAYHNEIDEIFNPHQSNPEDKKFWCVIFDMNNLKVINDSLGHIEGDITIRKTHAILTECFSQYGKIFRIGGDEFVAILKKCTAEDIEDCIALMHRKLDYANRGRSLSFSIACGYDEFHGNTREEFEEHFKSVDKKMYINKEAIKQNRARLIPPSDD